VQKSGALYIDEISSHLVSPHVRLLIGKQ